LDGHGFAEVERISGTYDCGIGEEESHYVVAVVRLAVSGVVEIRNACPYPRQYLRPSFPLSKVYSPMATTPAAYKCSCTVLKKMYKVSC
jgi:hypothetical protein